MLAADLARRDVLVQEILPARWPELADIWPLSAPVVAAHLPAIFTLGERHAQVLLALVTEDGGPPAMTEEMAADVGLLGGLFNAAIVTIDQLTDSGDGRLLGALTPSVLDAILDPGSASVTLDSLRRRACGNATAATAVELITAWVGLAQRLHAMSHNTAVWDVLTGTLGALLMAQRAVSGVVDSGSDGNVELVLTSAHLKSEGPSTAIAQMVALAFGPAHPVPERLWVAAARLGRVFCVVDDLADIVADARAGRPNVHLLRAHPLGGPLTDPEVYAVIGAAAEALTDSMTPTGEHEVDAFAVEVVDRWLRWDEHEGGIPPIGAPAAGRTMAEERAVRLLLDSLAAGDVGNSHQLALPRRGAGEVLETHSDDIFARAVVLDGLLDAFDAGLPVAPAVLHREALRLLMAKHPVARGGWSYLGSVPELPPDADDLAAILRVLSRLGGRPLAAACDEAVRLALDGTEASGGFPTWIVARRPATAFDAHMADYIEVVGGGGVHPEVVAHLADALAQSDPQRYGRVVAGCAAYLAGIQEPDGSWRSAWYAGPYYGTFRASRVLGAASAWPDCCARAQAFLVRRQRTDGGWGAGEQESLSTAFAVLALYALAPRECVDAIVAGADRLRAIQNLEGGWSSGPWISFPTRGGIVSYSGAATTAAFGLSALLCADAGGPVAPRASR